MASFPDHIQHYALDDQFLLFDEHCKQIRILNTTASYVCERWLAGASAREIAAELSKLTGTSLATTQSDTLALLEDWAATTFSLASTCDAAERAAEAAIEPSVYASVTHAAGAKRADAIRQRYRLLDFEFYVESDADLANPIDGLLGHLAVDTTDPNDDICLVTVEPAAARDAWHISIDGHVVGTCTQTNEIVPLVHANTLIMAYKQTQCLSVLHAAAVGRNGRGILMPAASGSGKSTLTAALVASGLDYYTDDLALLEGSPLRLLPAPTRLGIKQGSWTVLESRIPELAALPSHLRSDGRLIKYYLPRITRLPARHAPPVEIAALVFPRYVPGASMSLAAISRAEALVRFTEAGYDLPDSIDATWVQRMVDWMSGIDCLTLSYGDLNDATEAVDRLIA